MILASFSGVWFFFGTLNHSYLKYTGCPYRKENGQRDQILNQRQQNWVAEQVQGGGCSDCTRSILKFYKNRKRLLILISEGYFLLGHTLVYFVRSSMKSDREKMHESAIETARYGVGITVRPGPPIQTDGDCLISAAISQVIWIIWKICIKHVELKKP